MAPDPITANDFGSSFGVIASLYDQIFDVNDIFGSSFALAPVAIIKFLNEISLSFDLLVNFNKFSSKISALPDIWSMLFFLRRKPMPSDNDLATSLDLFITLSKSKVISFADIP